MRSLVVRLDGADPARGRLLGLLQAGFALPSRTGLSLRGFLREALRFSNEYIETAVTTVFLDGSPVDDLDAARLGPSSLVALSAAMPGLVGAIMRRQSPYASLREGISYIPPAGEGPAAADRVAAEDGLPAGGRVAAEGPAADGGGPATLGQPCRVRVKLFNSILRDRGMALLEAGLILGAAEVEAALGSRVGAGDVGGASDGAGEEGEPGRDGPPDAAPGDEALLWLRVAARPGRPARVTVKLFASLRRGRFETAVFELGAGATVEAALAAASLPPAEASIIFVNARHALPASPLAEGDLVSVFPPIGGG